MPWYDQEGEAKREGGWPSGQGCCRRDTRGMGANTQTTVEEKWERKDEKGGDDYLLCLIMQTLFYIIPTFLWSLLIFVLEVREK